MKNDDETRVLKGIPEGALFIIIYTKNIFTLFLQGYSKEKDRSYLVLNVDRRVL